MALYVFLNELSQPDNPIAAEPGGLVVNGLVELLRAVKRRRRDTVLHSAVPLRDVRIGESYSIAVWCNDGDRREEWRFLRSLQDRAPFQVRLAELGIDVMETDYRHGEDRAEGLGLAHMFGGLAVSLDYEPRWRDLSVLLTREALEEREDGEVDIVAADVETVHASHPDHVEEHGDWLEHACRQPVADGADLWRRRGELFPRLDFLPRVEGQLRALQASNPWFGAVAQRLDELNAVLGDWDPTNTPEPQYRSRVTPEHAQRKRLCRFEDLDGEARVFDLHARFTPGAGRLHFRLDPENRRAVVAHVGRKLGE
jgi:hypothetical protein